MHAAGYAVFVVRKRIHFCEAAVEKTGCVSEWDVVHFTSTMAAVNVRIVHSLNIFKRNFIVVRFNLH